jgi:DNA primase
MNDGNKPIERWQIQQIKDSADIAALIGRYVALKRTGSSYKGLSPFNKEKSPSFTVVPGKKIFKCFSSGEGGDVFKFYMLHFNLKFPEAVRRVADEINFRL